MPGNDIPKSDLFSLIYFDKWVHIGMFGLLTVLWCYPFIKANKGSTKLFAQISFCVILYGIAMEFVQKYFAIDRSFDLFDILADMVGSLLALLFVVQWAKRLRGN